jgi:radical SAM protein with 4Fe4S-binding SPASM domain
MDYLKLSPKIKSKKIVINFDEFLLQGGGCRDLISRLLGFLDDHESDFGVKIKNLPFCLFPTPARDHILAGSGQKGAGSKTGDCRLCKYDSRCSGFSKIFLKNFGLPQIEPIKDIPNEVMIEVEPGCNFRCQFCFNKHAFARRGRDIENKLTPDLVMGIIDAVKKAGVKVVRFTGGEPLLRRDLLALLRYAKYQNLEVRINTNGALIDENWAKKIVGVVDNALMPFEDWQEKEESRICGFPGVLKRKIRAIKILKKAKIPVVRVGTVATRRIIHNFGKMAKLVCSLPIDDWEFFRPIPAAAISSPHQNEVWCGDKHPISRQDLDKMADNLTDLKKKTGRHYFIATAVPFCASPDKNKMNSVSLGAAAADDGHLRFVIDPRGYAKPHYFLDKNIGNPLDILKCWNHPFMKKMRNFGFIPKICRNCDFLEKCRGGSRFLANLYFGRWDAKDPLMP